MKEESKPVDFNVSIKEENYSVPFMVHQEIMFLRTEVNHYKRLANGWKDATIEKPRIGLNVHVITTDMKEEIAHLSNSNSWYDCEEPIEYDVIYWRNKKKQ